MIEEKEAKKLRKGKIYLTWWGLLQRMKQQTNDLERLQLVCDFMDEQRAFGYSWIGEYTYRCVELLKQEEIWKQKK